MKNAVLCILILLSGCRSIFGDDEERKVGIIPGMGTSDVAIVMPDSAFVDQDLLVVVTTGWRNSCARIGDAEVDTRGLDVTITPIDIISDNGSICLQGIQTFEHRVAIRFTEEGLANITIRGRAGDNAPVTEYVRQIPVTTANP